MTQRLVIAGGGHAAAQLCASLAERCYAGQVTLVTEERHLPYHRPPLSKALISNAAAVLPELRDAALYAQHGVTVSLETRVAAIDRAHRLLALEGGAALPYDHLVLATGARARTLPGQPAGQGIFYLRSFDEAVALRTQALSAHRVLVLGGGFMGLELAATLRALGKEVVLIDSAPRLMARAVSPEISGYVLKAHRASGITILLNQSISRVVVRQGRFQALALAGQTLKADMLVVGIGSMPNTGLAEAAGLHCDNGARVDEMLVTSDTAISAIGDCTSFYYPPWMRHVRLESVQNANQQARALAARLCGSGSPFANLPWFWSDQGHIRLQMTGLWRPGYRQQVTAVNDNGGFSVMHHEGDVLRAVESVNAAPEQMRLRKAMRENLVDSQPAPIAPAVR